MFDLSIIHRHHMEGCLAAGRRHGQGYSQYLEERLREMHQTNIQCAPCPYRPADLESGYMMCMTCRRFADQM